MVIFYCYDKTIENSKNNTFKGAFVMNDYNFNQQGGADPQQPADSTQPQQPQQPYGGYRRSDAPQQPYGGAQWQQPPQQPPYNAATGQPGGPQAEYRWNFEDYEASGRNDRKRKKKQGSGLMVLAALLGAVVLVSVLFLAGYGVYSMLVPSENVQNPAISSSQQQPVDPSASSEGALTTAPGLNIIETPAGSGVAGSDDGLSTMEIAAKISPSVVGIAQYSGYDTFNPSGEGSGIIISEEGYIITNAHVVEGAAGINVELHNGETYVAQLIGIDAKTDLAVLKIGAEGLVAAEFGNSDELKVGERVIAIGNPGGSVLQGSVTQGIVSGVNRSLQEQHGISFIQTDAAINPGNSGGALVNRFGQVIGINSAKIANVSYEGIGFAIPSSEAKPIVDDLMQYGYVKGRCKIGITGQEINDALSQMNNIPVGIYIWSVETTADIAGKGISKGDIITAIDGQKVETFEDISDILKGKQPGDTVTLTIYRSARGMPNSGQTFTVGIELMEDADRSASTQR